MIKMGLGYAWRSHNSLQRAVMAQHPVGKTPLGTPIMLWQDLVKKGRGTVGSR